MSFPSTADPSAQAGSTYAVEPTSSSTLIAVDTVVDGTITTSQDLRVDGRVSGTVTCEGVLHIAEGAIVDATVDAAGIVVAGSLSGAISCQGRLEIRSTGVVRGRVETGRLIVVEGAVYEGQLRMDPVQPDDASATSPPPVEPTIAPTTQPSTGSYSFLRSFGSESTPSGESDDVLPAVSEEEEPE